MSKELMNTTEMKSYFKRTACMKVFEHATTVLQRPFTAHRSTT